MRGRREALVILRVKGALVESRERCVLVESFVVVRHTMAVLYGEAIEMRLGQARRM